MYYADYYAERIMECGRGGAEHFVAKCGETMRLYGGHYFFILFFSVVICKGALCRVLFLCVIFAKNNLTNRNRAFSLFTLQREIKNKK